MTYFSQFRQRDYILSDTVVKNLTDISQYTEIFSRAADDFAFYTFYNARPDERFDTISNELYGTPDYYWTIPILNDRIVNTWRDTTKSVNSLKESIARRYPGRAITIDPTVEFFGLFTLGETVVYNGNMYTVLNVYPTQGYLQVETVVTNQDTSGIDSQNRVVGLTSGSSADATGIVDMIDAPAYFVDTDGNRVPWYTTNATEVSIRNDEFERNELLARLKVVRPDYIREVIDRFELEMRRADDDEVL